MCFLPFAVTWESAERKLDGELTLHMTNAEWIDGKWSRGFKWRLSRRVKSFGNGIRERSYIIEGPMR